MHANTQLIAVGKRGNGNLALYLILGLCSFQMVSVIIRIPNQFPDDYKVKHLNTLQIMACYNHLNTGPLFNDWPLGKWPFLSGFQMEGPDKQVRNSDFFRYRIPTVCWITFVTSSKLVLIYDVIARDLLPVWQPSTLTLQLLPVFSMSIILSGEYFHLKKN